MQEEALTNPDLYITGKECRPVHREIPAESQEMQL